MTDTFVAPTREDVVRRIRLIERAGYYDRPVSPSPTRTGTITNAALTTNVATLTTGAAHPLLVGQLVTVAGVTPALFNGTYTITARTATTFSYAKVNADVAAAAATGTFSSPGPMAADDPTASDILAAHDEDDDMFNPRAHTVAEVHEYLNEHPDDVVVVLDAELAGKNRVSLVAALWDRLNDETDEPDDETDEPE